MINAWNGQQAIWLRVVREALVERFGTSDELETRAQQFVKDHHAELEIACNKLVQQGRIERCDQTGLGPHLAVKILEGQLDGFVPKQRI
jgi:hypothetical protein